MGIKDLHKLIKNDNLIKIKDCREYKYRIVAVDISLVLHKIIISIRNSGNDLINSEGEVVSHITGLFNKTVNLLEYLIIPIYVFDGKAPELKRDTINLRKEAKRKALDKLAKVESSEERIKYLKRSVFITKKQIDDCKTLLTLMGLPYVEAPEEADSQCAYLAHKGLVDAVSTEDMDILTFGSPKIVRNLPSRHESNISEIDLIQVLTKFKLTFEQFQDLCILLGCDYCSTLKEVNKHNAVLLLQKYGSIENIIDQMNIKPNKKFNYEEVREYFKRPLVLKTESDDLKLSYPNNELLFDFLVNQYKLNEKVIVRNMKKIHRSYGLIRTRKPFLFC